MNAGAVEGDAASAPKSSKEDKRSIRTEPHVYAQESPIQPYIGSFWSSCKTKCIGEWLCPLRSRTDTPRALTDTTLFTMSILGTSSDVRIHNSEMTAIQNQINHYHGTTPQDLYRILSPVGDASHTRPGPVAKCYPGTRLEVIANVEKWIKDGGSRPVLWLNGPAGSGKSAISQTIAECDEDRICASFFFLRGAGQRSRIQLLIPTLVHQVTLSMPNSKGIIADILKNEPYIFHQQALEHQLKKLLINPVREAHKKGLSEKKKRIIIIDALDECDDKEKMAEFIKAITILCNTPGFQLPFMLLLTSRVEKHIQQQFNDPKTQSVIHYLSLGDFNATKDIKLYLKSQLSTIYACNNTIMRHLPQPWPSMDQLEQLSRNAEGSFIIASTLVKFIGNDTSHPHDQLEKALHMADGLDPVYYQVITTAFQGNKIMLDILGKVLVVLALAEEPLSITDIGIMLQIKEYHIVYMLSGLQAILLIPENDDEPVKWFHTSLRDYLCTKDRSRNLFIDLWQSHAMLAMKCLKVIVEYSTKEKSDINQSINSYACNYWLHHLNQALEKAPDVVYWAMALEDFSNTATLNEIRGLRKIPKYVDEIFEDCESLLKVDYINHRDENQC
ncbi:hypothetical protein BDQ12DRAFT_714067 [Crucibulum laeve]|uniref:Nephrocystin 3-like N-terminal domain-containing protein n=1 Tax=Crucibulum laeve TaxID=68775 RepID=A0A5C3LUY7_9AGAR|nr:hypothetical protein BDQ12DRAFT_714067 [Crucibulum laeve]